MTSVSRVANLPIKVKEPSCIPTLFSTVRWDNKDEILRPSDRLCEVSNVKEAGTSESLDRKVLLQLDHEGGSRVLFDLEAVEGTVIQLTPDAGASIQLKLLKVR